MTGFSPQELAQFRQQDPGLFKSIVSEYSPRIFAWVRPFTNTADEAEDLLQEVWRRVLVRRMQFRGSGGFASWLYTVTRSVSVDHVRKESVRKRAAEGVHRAELHQGVPCGLVEDERIRERHRALHEALTTLPDRQRQAVLLRVFEGLSTRETANVMSCAEGTVKASLSHAIGNLRKRLKGHPGTAATAGNIFNKKDSAL